MGPVDASQCATIPVSPLTRATTARTAAAVSDASATGVAAVGAVQDRLTVAYESVIAVLDGQTLEVIEEFESEEFTSLNAAGDGQTVLVTMSDGFQAFDTVQPELTDLVFPAETPGHVVRHAGKTVLYDDGTSDTHVIDTSVLAENDGRLRRGW